MQLYVWMEFKLRELDGAGYGTVAAIAESPEHARKILTDELMAYGRRQFVYRELDSVEYKTMDEVDREMQCARRNNFAKAITEALKEEPEVRQHLIFHG